MLATARSRHAAVVSADLPSAPNDREMYLYLGPQWRWVFPIGLVAYGLVLVSMVLYIRSHPWTLLFALPLALSTFATLQSFYTSTRKRRDSIASHQARLGSWAPKQTPSIDVFLPSAGEDLEVLENTYAHVAKLTWPGKLNAYVLDDSGRDEVRALAQRFGLHYRTRPNRGEHKKSGNLRYGFDQTNGDFILVLDADFVPRPDALLHLTPYMEDEQVGIVQSPQFFDIDTRMPWLQRAAGATQILFYRWVQPSRDALDAAICVGTSALYRRQALTDAGGFALIGHSEDVHTGINLTMAGYRVRYVPLIVTKGLCPDKLDQFLTQQYRWCTGSMSLLMSKRFHNSPLKPRQKLCYWSGFLYYITTAVNVLTMQLPPLVLAIFFPTAINVSNYVFVALALVTRNTVIPFITLRSESFTGMARIQATYSFAHALALWDILRNRTDAWVATGVKTRSRTAVRVHRLIRWYTIVFQVGMWTMVAIRVPQYGLHDWWPLMVLLGLNLFVMMPVLRADQRGWSVAHSLATRAQDSAATATVLGIPRQITLEQANEADQVVIPPSSISLRRSVLRLED